MTSTCHELRLKSRSPDRENKVTTSSVEDEESRILKEKMAEMLSDEFVTVEPRQHSILKHLKLLVDSVRRHHLVCIPFLHILSLLINNIIINYIVSALFVSTSRTGSRNNGSSFSVVSMYILCLI